MPRPLWNPESLESEILTGPHQRAHESEHLVQPEPDDRPPARADRLGEVDPEGGAFQEGEQRDVQPQADPDAVDDRPEAPGQVRLADVVEERAEEVAGADDVIQHVAVDPGPDREPPLDG